MTMSFNLIAVLLSLAMMLTGAGGEGMPAQARSVVLHDVNFTYNGESVALDPALRLGASTDGKTAVYELGVDVKGETLFPIQLGVSEDGVTALLNKGDVAVKLTADALEGAFQAVADSVTGMVDQAQAEVENPELLKFITEEYLPAYTGLLEAAQDEALAEEINAKADALMDEIVDRGEGTPVTVMIEGENYDLTAYSYAIEGDQLAKLIDEVFTLAEPLQNYHDAMFKLYGMMPEESGLNGIASYADLFEKTGLQMRMDVEEQRSDDGSVEITNATLTMDMNAMVETMAAASKDGEETPKLAPVVMYIEANEIDGVKDANVSFDYEIEGVGMGMYVTAYQSEGFLTLDMNMTLSQEGQELGGLSVSAVNNHDEDAGDDTYSLLYNVSVEGMADVSFGLAGFAGKDGVSQNTVNLDAEYDDQSFSLSFNVDVTDAPIQDLANGREDALVISDLSEEALNALGEDEAFMSAMMQGIGSLSADAQKLMGDESVQQLTGLFTAVMASQEVYDYDYDMDEDYDYEDYEEVEDDGVLPFAEPAFTWLPEGWSLTESNVDTAYDWADYSLSDAAGDNNLYAIFFDDSDNEQTNYTVANDGSVVPVEGREITVSDYGYGSISVTLREGGVYCNLMFDGKGVDLETIGKIVAGIQFNK